MLISQQDDQLVLYIVDNHEKVFQEILEPWMIETYLLSRPDIWECIGRDGKVPLEKQIPFSLKKFAAKWAPQTLDTKIPDQVFDLNPLSNLLPGESSWRHKEIINHMHKGIVPIINRRTGYSHEYSWDKMFQGFSDLEEIPKERFIAKVLGPYVDLILGRKFPVSKYVKTTKKPRLGFNHPELDFLAEPKTLRELVEYRGTYYNKIPERKYVQSDWDICRCMLNDFLKNKLIKEVTV
jgi:hypothetical protein